MKTPTALFCFGIAWGFYFSAGAGEGWAPFLRVLAFLIAASGIALSLLGKRGLMTVIIGIGFFLGISLEIEVYRSNNRASWGLPISEIEFFEGRILADSRITSGGNSIFPFEATRVGDGRGNRASCYLRLLVVFAGHGKFFWGGKLLFRGKAYPGKDDNPVIIAAEAGIQACSAGGFFYQTRSVLLTGAAAIFDNLGNPWGGLLEALLLGIQDDLPSALKESFLRAGVVHILALSGMHLGILVFFIAVFLRPLVGPRGGDLLSVLFTVVYVVLVGPKPSILRACFMVVPFLLLRAGGRRPEPFVLFSLSFIIMGLFSKEDLNSLSFHLSFLAMGGILLFTSPARRLVSPFLPEPALSPLAVSVAAQLATAPLQVLRFGILYPAGFFSAVLLGPLITVFLGTGLVSCIVLGLFPGVPFLRHGLQFLLKNLYTGIVMVVEIFSRFPSWELVSLGDFILLGILFGSGTTIFFFLPLGRALKRDGNDSL
jgi:competence protein ComEC